MSSIAWWIVVTIAPYLILGLISTVGSRRGRTRTYLFLPAAIFYIGILPWWNLAFQPKHGSMLLLIWTWFLSVIGFGMSIVTVQVTNRPEVLPERRLLRPEVFLWSYFAAGASGIM